MKKKILYNQKTMEGRSTLPDESRAGSSTCRHVFINGPRCGQRCPQFQSYKSDYCYLHGKCEHGNISKKCSKCATPQLCVHNNKNGNCRLCSSSMMNFLNSGRL